MKNILFLMTYPLAPDRKHHTQKFDGQMIAAKNLGYDVWYTGYENESIYLCHNDEKIKIGSMTRSEQNIVIFHAICSLMPKIIYYKRFEYCYIRYTPCLPSTIKALQILKKHEAKIIVEIPTFPWKDEIKNYPIVKRLAILTLTALFEKRMLRYVDLFVLIGNQAADYRGVKAINIANGINIAENPLRKPQRKDNEIHILALAKMAIWHGYDRLIEGLYQYKQKGGRENVIVHLVGNDGDGSLAKWKNLVERYGLNNCVISEGLKLGQALDDIYDLCDLGIGSLGMYRKKLNTDSSLKISEYCARGLPFVSATHHNLLDDEISLRFMVPNNDTAINLSDIIEFAKRTRADHMLIYQMREHAIKNMTWESQLKKILDTVNRKTNY